ncbi:MAG: hypothetical protein ACKOZY_01340, partial [Flavobacteriales bacterium]
MSSHSWISTTLSSCTWNSKLKCKGKYMPRKIKPATLGWHLVHKPSADSKTVLLAMRMYKKILDKRSMYCGVGTSESDSVS